MRRIERLEDLIAWQKARVLTKDFNKVNDLALEVGRIIGGMRASVQKQKEAIK